jgi:hypothetical protein
MQCKNACTTPRQDRARTAPGPGKRAGACDELHATATRRCHGARSAHETRQQLRTTVRMKQHWSLEAQ